jgi:hypothetical protein
LTESTEVTSKLWHGRPALIVLIVLALGVTIDVDKGLGHLLFA